MNIDEEDITIERIKFLMSSLKINQVEFAQALSISPASLSSILTKRTKPTLNHIKAITKVFPEINLYWLLNEDEPMFKEEAYTLDDFEKKYVQETKKPNQEIGFWGVASHKTNDKQAENLAKESANLFINNNLIVNEKKRLEEEASESVMSGSYEERTPKVILQKEMKRISEIRVFYDDGTFELFVPHSVKS